jgi:acid stress-induced BolA-like protein IbaG/YrbA
MGLRILSSPSESGDGDVAGDIERAIAGKIPGAQIEVTPRSPGHFEIRVISEAFVDKGRVQQQQLVYAAIAHMMKGDAAPVHAVDQLTTELP